MSTDVAELPQAEIALEEALQLAPIAHKRMVGSERFVIAYQVAGLALGLLAGSLIGGLIPLASLMAGAAVPLWLAIDALPLLAGIFGWCIGLRQAQARHYAKFVAGIRARGTPESVPASYRMLDEGVHILTPRVSYLVAWDAILEVIPAGDVWLLQVDTTSFLLPKRAFPNSDQERAFLSELLGRVRLEARERSGEAVAFAG